LLQKSRFHLLLLRQWHFMG